jgi:hypothetical protein
MRPGRVDSLARMQQWTVAAILCLVAAGSSLFVGQLLLARSRDVTALYWFATGAVALRASLVIAGERRP